MPQAKSRSTSSTSTIKSQLSDAQLDERARKIARRQLSALATWKPPVDIQQLLVFSVVLKGMGDAIQAICNQPRAAAANDVLEDWHNAFSGLGHEIVETVRRISPATQHEAAWKAEILMDWEMRCGMDDPLRTVAVINQMMFETVALDRAERQKTAASNAQARAS
jgi:hypothetical protein